MSTQESDSNDDSNEALKQKLLDFAADFPFFKHMGLEVEDMSPGYARVSVELVAGVFGIALIGRRQKQRMCFRHG